MKFTELQNYTDGRIAITQVRGLVFSPGEIKKVHPNTVKHPAVRVYIDNGLRVVTEGAAPTQEPKAPVQTTPAPVDPPAPEVSDPSEDAAPAAPEDTAPDAAPEAGDDSATQSNDASSGDLRDLYVSAPGITESNVDAVLEAFPTVETLKEASKNALVDCGVSKNQAKRVLSWAAEQK